MVRTGNGGGLAARGVIFTQSELVVSGQGGNSNSWDDRAEREDSRTKYNLFETQRYWRPKSVACLNSLRPKLHSNRFYRLWSIWVEELLLLGQLRDRIQRGDRIFFSRVLSLLGSVYRDGCLRVSWQNWLTDYNMLEEVEEEADRMPWAGQWRLFARMC